MLPFNRSDLERLFPTTIWKKAEDLVANGAVLDAEVERDGRSVTGRIKGERRAPYLTRVKIANGRGGRIKITSTCTCLVYSECEHAAATLLGLLDKTAAPGPDDVVGSIDQELEAWIGAVNAAARQPGTNGSAEGHETILYLLEPAQRAWRDQGVAQPIMVVTVRARQLAGGAYGREQPVSIANLVAEEAPSYVQLEDQIIGRLLGGVPNHNRRLGAAADGETLKRILETGRCHWRNGQGLPLRYAEPRKGRFYWRFDADGQQRCLCELERGGEDTLVVALGQPWYIDTKSREVGPVETTVPERVATLLLRAPAVPATVATVVRQKLQPSAELLPLPEPLKKREQLEVKPKPVMHLHCPRVLVSRGLGWDRREEEVDLPLARVTFDYAGCEVGWQDGRTELNHVVDNRLLVMPRDAVAEVQMIERLNALGLQPLGPTGLGRFAPESCRQDFTFEEDEEDDDISMRWVEFNHKELPKLAAEGWRITFAENYPYRVVQAEDDWRVEVTDSGIDWFDLDIGIVVDGEKISLLPILLDLFKRAPEELAAGQLDSYGDEPVYGTLPDGRLVPIPASRLKAVLDAMHELFAGGRIKPGEPLRLARAEATRLVALEGALPPGRLRWVGGEELRAVAQRLVEAGGIPLVPQPAALKAQLRPYQQQGLSWLQFLSSVGLSGVLADDMGLGKTLQALAHILMEKQCGRLDRPVLIVAPTSLIPTWRSEIRKFAPDLRLLILHGNDRKELFDSIDQHDVVLTSYALLIRDRDELVARQFRLVVLDEAQAIKNPTTKLARTAVQLQAEQRLALTGTPIENHLGELWSVFNFLVPGLLGDREVFRRVFRNRIEKEGDAERQALLVSRVRPFMLRRTKEQVASELPPKTEMLREIELTDAQRDLYETVRLAMHERVRAEIKARGLAQSSIAILEALLKLRQVCCDPRLLKSQKSDEPVPSAKFELLMEMLPSMVETGRKIIVFSQFVEMLDLIDDGLTRQGLPFVKLTGRTRDRETPVKRFQAGEVPIFLISLKAGGVGLTLTAADTVIHYDPWWNPAVEAQATDRAHRIGQDKTVFVYKLIAAGTVEEKMVELQGRKKALYEGVLGGGGAGLAFTEEDIENLFAPLPKD
ncbi:MAG: DEAD/DEAH box helicase [Geminicoccaceae bacterium]|nr:DEAD/DEAH box helicase [Geminicoccaceae bacterium]